MSLLEPVAAILLTQQLRYADAAEVLKAAFVQASARAFAAGGKVPSVSTLSVATGIGRVEVKRVLDLPLSNKAPRLSPARQVRLRWLTDPDYLDEHGQPRRLPRVSASGQVSFATLAGAATKDTHPRAVLDELVRLGIAVEEGEYVSMRQTSLGGDGADKSWQAGINNARDHMSAVLVNMLNSPSPLLERAMHAQKLTKESAGRGVSAAADVWLKMRAELRDKLQTLVDLDDDASDNNWRVSIGVYSYMAPIERAAPPISARANTKKAGGRTGVRRRRKKLVAD